jgi:hypothetical protein
MDGPQFDDIARAVGTSTSRRGVLRRLGVGLVGLGGALNLAVAQPGGAERKHQRVRTQAKGTKGPDQCAQLCADQPGARGAGCRQACKTCAGGAASFCFDPTNRTCGCAAGTGTYCPTSAGTTTCATCLNSGAACPDGCVADGFTPCPACCGAAAVGFCFIGSLACPGPSPCC